MDTSKAVWYVVHVQGANNEHATVRVGQMGPDGTAIKGNAEEAVTNAIKLTAARGIKPPFDVVGFGPFNEVQSRVMYDLFDGEKLNDEQNRQLLLRLQEQTGEMWFDMRKRDN